MHGPEKITHDGRVIQGVSDGLHEIGMTGIPLEHAFGIDAGRRLFEPIKAGASGAPPTRIR